MEITVTKNYHGYVSVRDYLLQECIDKNDKLVINHDKQKMTLVGDGLKTGIVLCPIVFCSDYNSGQEYTLVDFKFKPDQRGPNGS
jgi:hypothetical protein